MPALPPKKQIRAEGHETVAKSVTPGGGVASDHVAPPLFVMITEERTAPSSPTATQVAVVGELLGAHETALTLAKGA
jgi:hypothetical protein